MYLAGVHQQSSCRSLQRLWEEHLNWDELVSPAVSKVWENWMSKITELRHCLIHRSYSPKEANITTIQLHGFRDASEVVYAGVVLSPWNWLEGNYTHEFGCGQNEGGPDKMDNYPSTGIVWGFNFGQVAYTYISSAERSRRKYICMDQ